MRIAALADPKNRTALLMLAVVIGMGALGFYSYALYRIFCQTTGYGGTTQRALSAPGAVAGKTIVIRFDANKDPKLPWLFKPEVTTQTITIGAQNLAFFDAENLTDHPITGQAAYNVSPDSAGSYFKKIQCFCFTQQTLQPHEHVRMPVQFFVDPKILDDNDMKNVQEITLSYTFYPVDPAKKSR